ncbi:Jun dimerization protein 2, partial [Eschrichtius robustus]|nr:Jun dimerization protein 2 [Eschrichtius robustus]
MNPGMPTYSESILGPAGKRCHPTRQEASGLPVRLTDGEMWLDEEEERRKRRREKNKVAAARCRNKKKERTEFLQRAFPAPQKR